MGPREKVSGRGAVLPHLFGHGDDPRQAFEALTFRGRKTSAPPFQGSAWHDEIAQRLNLDIVSFRQAGEQRAHGGFRQTFGDDVVEVIERSHPMLERSRAAEDARNPLDIDHGSL